MAADDGYIKFKCDLVKSGVVIPEELYTEINKWRNKMYSLNLIGAYDNGVGFGNISVRIPGTKQFYVSGSATGNYKITSPEHYVLVNSYNFKQNSLKCMGPLPASSESLSHAAIYEADVRTNAVIHIHNLEMWEKGIRKYPVTKPEYSFGTPEIALDITDLLNDETTGKNGIIIMGGHKEGILFFGESLEEAGIISLKYYKGLTK